MSFVNIIIMFLKVGNEKTRQCNKYASFLGLNIDQKLDYNKHTEHTEYILL